MKVVTREEWKARSPKSSSPMTKSEGIHVHHTVGSNLGRDDCAAWVRSIQQYHMDVKNWWDIGYSFLVCKHGHVYVGRGWGTAGAHTTGYNSTSHGIAYLGDGGEEIPKKVVWAYQNLVISHDKRYGKGYVKGHRDRAQTACPGDKLYARLARIRKAPMYAIRWRIRRPDRTLGPSLKRRGALRRLREVWMKRIKPGVMVGLKKVRRRV